ncbi:MAG: restriction endonuclease subunit S [Thermodesulfobacteriota bacterium]
MRQDWVETDIGNAGKVISGGTPKTSNAEYWGDEIPWVTPADLSGYTQKFISKGRKSITATGLKNSSAKLMPANSVLFSSRAPIGYVAIAKNNICTNQGFKSLVPFDCLNSEFIYYYFKSIKQKAENHASGTTFKELSAKAFSALPIPLAPLPEQRAIVAKIEKLFSDLDNGIANLKAAKAKLDIYRQALLKKAFEGELTREWREQRDVNGWQELMISQIGEIVTGNTPSKKNEEFYSSHDYNFYKPTDLEAGHNVFKSIDGLSLKGFQNGRQAPENSILVTCIGATIGKTGLIKLRGCFNQQINAIIPSDKYNPKYVYYQAIGIDFQTQIKKRASSTTLPILNKGKFSTLMMKVCAIGEQTVIVAAIESRLSVCDKLAESIDQSLEQSEALRQSILKKAFAGKLLDEAELAACRREPDWEPAASLLERIQKEKSGRSAKKTGEKQMKN